MTHPSSENLLRKLGRRYNAEKTDKHYGKNCKDEVRIQIENGKEAVPSDCTNLVKRERESSSMSDPLKNSLEILRSNYSKSDGPLSLATYIAEPSTTQKPIRK